MDKPKIIDCFRRIASAEEEVQRDPVVAEANSSATTGGAMLGLYRGILWELAMALEDERPELAEISIPI